MMLKKMRDKLSRRSATERQQAALKSSGRAQKVRSFASPLEEARYFEQLGQWSRAVQAWVGHARQTASNGELPLDEFIELAYASSQALSDAGPDFSANDATVRRMADNIAVRVGSREPLAFSRPACFKGIDLLLKYQTRSTAVELLMAFGADLDLDDELRSKFLHQVLGLSSHCDWVWAENPLRQRVQLFNNVVLDYCTRHPEGEGTSYFLLARRYGVECLIRGQSPSGVELWRRLRESDDAADASLPFDLNESFSRLSVYLDHSLVDSVASLALFHPLLLKDVIESSRTGVMFEKSIRNLAHLAPRYLIITNLGYPMGGGESFMHQTCAILSEFGFDNSWVSFADKDGQPYPTTSSSDTPFYRDIRVMGGFSYEAAKKAIVDHGADVVHSQGMSNGVVAQAAQETRIPSLIGFHFWSGLVRLGIAGNRQIQNHADFHQLDEAISARGDCQVYVASEFMRDVYQAVGGTRSLKVFHPTPDPAHYGVSEYERRDANFVTQINLAQGKGGDIFLHCLREMRGDGIPFLGVHSESVGGDLMTQIVDAAGGCSGSRLETYGPAHHIYARSKIVIVPTQVDETFCRVAFEAAANGIPVLSTKAGYLPYMLGDSGYYLPEDDRQAWVDALRVLCRAPQLLAELGARQRAHVREKFGAYPHAFLDEMLRIAREKIPRKNIGFFSTWSDQGLGYQVRHYSHLLRRAGFRTHVFSFLSYKAIGENTRNQRNAMDWDVPTHADSVYYSLNDREHVSRSEMEQFVRAHRVGALIYPEICWEINWQNLAQISIPGLFILGVPNLEIVRKSEIMGHQRLLSRTLCPTRAVEHILYSHGVRNTTYIGHGFGPPIDAQRLNEKLGRLTADGEIRFLHVGGHNPRSRKQTPHVIDAFLKALETRSDIHLVVTVMDSEFIDFPEHPNIQYILGGQGHDEVMHLYETCHASIQVSSHEGVGLGFYESVACATPVISLDVPPHNEIILSGLTGWLLPAELEDLQDNNDAVSRAAKFDVKELADVIGTLDIVDVARMIQSTAKVHAQRFEDRQFGLRLVGALP